MILQEQRLLHESVPMMTPILEEGALRRPGNRNPEIPKA